MKLRFLVDVRVQRTVHNSDTYAWYYTAHSGNSATTFQYKPSVLSLKVPWRKYRWVVPKRRLRITSLRCETYQKSAHLKYICNPDTLLVLS